MPQNSMKMCCGCDTSGSQSARRCCCQSCGRMLCEKCVKDCGIHVVELERMNSSNETRNIIKSCKFCSEVTVRHEGETKYCEKVHPTTDSPDPPSPCSGGENEFIPSDRLALYLNARDHDYSPPVLSGSRIPFSAYPSPIFVRHSQNRSDEEDAEDTGNDFFSPSYQDISDTDSCSVSARHEFYSCQSVGSSPSDSPARINFTSNRFGRLVLQRQGSLVSRQSGPFHQEKMTVLKGSEPRNDDPENTDNCSDEISVFRNQCNKSQKPLDFENNGFMWFPPPPDDEGDEAESNFFEYDDEDDEIGDSGAMFSSSSSLSSMFPAKEKHNEGNKEPLRAVIVGHFRALVSELLQAEGIAVGKENSDENWLDIVTTIAWQAANFVKPDTSKGGSMDPGDYVRIKCIASGSPSESTLIKGVVCTKNIKHKRMTSQYKNARLLLLGGSLEYQRVPNQLASFNTLLQQENDHLKMVISKIEALRPNVLLVERSVSSYAQEYLLAKEISLVLNVKRPLLERIARCTGALVTPSIDNISGSRLGHCEFFRVERVSEEHETANQFNKKPSKTLMFFEGCPRRLGCTVLIRGMCREELKKVKYVVQYATFAAYHLSLETSFLADEGASLPKMVTKPSIIIPERILADNSISLISAPVSPTYILAAEADASTQDELSACLNLEHGVLESSSEHLDLAPVSPSYLGYIESMDYQVGSVPTDAFDSGLSYNAGAHSRTLNCCEDFNGITEFPSDLRRLPQQQIQDITNQDDRKNQDVVDSAKPENIDEVDVSSEYLSANDTYQSILVSFSSRCVLKGTVCERSRLLRIKFYGSFDKPLGRYLCDDLFDQTSCCQFCNESAEAHVQCYTHQQGNLTINVKRLSSLKLPGERDGKIWMWHRCLSCMHIDGVPPATRRVVMSDAAWGLSFGKFLELSFSNHATANRIAPCGHSLQRDCLRYYGFGSMVAFFRYSPIDILSVQLPSSVIEFDGHIPQEWIKNEAAELMSKMETLYKEISNMLDDIDQKCKSPGNEVSDITELHNHIIELKNLHQTQRNDYREVLQLAGMVNLQLGEKAIDILELNRLRRSLLIGSHFWDRQLYSLDSLLKKNPRSTLTHGDAPYLPLKELRKDESFKNFNHDQESMWNDMQLDHESNMPLSEFCAPEVSLSDISESPSESIHSHASNLSERIDSAWTGTDQLPMKAQPLHDSQVDRFQPGSLQQGEIENPPFRRLMSPVRVHSFESALKFHDKLQKGLPSSSLHMSTGRSFCTSEDYRSNTRDPVSSIMRTYSQLLPWEAQKLNLVLSSAPSFISATHMAEGPMLLLPQTGNSDIVIAVYENEPTSIISYALSTKEYEEWVADKSNGHEDENIKEGSSSSNFSPWRSFGSLDLEYIHYGSLGSEDASASANTMLKDSKRSPHLRITFMDKSSAAVSKLKFSVTSYFAKQFDELRRKCCPDEVNFLCSLSRCKKWSAQGGKSNVYFAKSLDERFIVKQVTKTELESFEDFALEYFKYLNDSLNSRSPTCLAKVLGIYQVCVKNLKGGKETKMDLMVMENLFYKRNISRIYDLKGSTRSRYNPDTTGKNNVLLDTNLLETLRTDPIFLGSKAKRNLERAVWNDTSFLASVDVMDYSLLVGIDEERKELVLGIIDFMRQYTWDKHLETWVKASGILGGPKNAAPTIISPKQYKKRFRKAMTTYFLTVPDQWSS